ncbi:cob(I)yrinic acid a,c-diamide adenosyltransferase [Candidatus Nomurabacteria bacterium]|nr:cob(I)yrinic acid a,c-diamide adenosyltransferase [Candidatus Nomurabacteria bacterium]
MLFTGKGDGGTTKTFGCNQRISKSSAITEALGSLDEINSFLGLLKVKSVDIIFPLESGNINLALTINRIQQDLFIVQAELAGADKTISEEKVKWLEQIINEVEKCLPPITTFFVSGGCELASLADIARTIARRAERRVVGVVDESKQVQAELEETKEVVSKQTLAYLNRLSSVLYATARMANHINGVVEESPNYK